MTEVTFLRRQGDPDFKDRVTRAGRVEKPVRLDDRTPFADARTCALFFAAGMFAAYILSHIGG